MAMHDSQYLQLVDHVLKRGVYKGDRTGTGTYSVFGYTMRFDLRDGTIPMLTSKKMHTKSIIHEILWYLEGNTSSDDLMRKGVSIWQEWADERGELHKVYGHQWRNWASNPHAVVFVDPVDVVDSPTPAPRLPMVPVDHSTGDDFVGTLHATSECGDVVVVRRAARAPDGEWLYDIQFVDTGYMRRDVRKGVIRRGHIIDRYLPRVYGVGYLGDYDDTDPNLKQLQRHWYKILERCYDPSVTEYYDYGARGVFVHSDWHCFATFQHDVKHIPNWNNKRQNTRLYDLDKDYYGGACYSKHTCVWLLRKHNTLYRKNPRPFRVVTPDGGEHIRLSVEDVCNEYGLSKSLVYGVLNGTRRHHKQFKFEFIDPPPGTLARYQLPIDQIASLVHKLTNAPDDRRMIVSAWNVADLADMRLPPCHYTFQCYTRPLSQHERVLYASRQYSVYDLFNVPADSIDAILDEAGVPTRELSLMLNQRSCDVGLGVPFNIVQYSILLRMLAEVSNMAPGDFIWNGGDVHIYANHVDGLKEQLARPLSYQSPTLTFARQVESIDNFQYGDFVIQGYESHPKIALPVAV